VKWNDAVFAPAVAALLLAGCSTAPVVLNSVGPAPVHSVAYRPQGGLRVYSAVETREIGENTFYYPHTGYSLYTASGKLWKYIPNHISDEDECPALVTVPAGHYTVKALANFDVWGTVATTVLVPVVIQEDKLTELHLESDWKAPANISTNAFVYLPGGKPVGWRSLPANLIPSGRAGGS